MEKSSATSNTNTCRSMVPTTTLPPSPTDSQLAYFINISINKKKLHDPLANLRIKIPKLLAKTVKKTHQPNNNNVGGGGGGNGGSSSSSSPNSNNKGKTIKRKVKSLLSDVVGGVKKSGIPALSDAFADVKKSDTPKTTFDPHDHGNKDICRNRVSLASHFDRNESDELEFSISESMSSRSDHLNSDLEYFATKSPLWDDAKQIINKEQICKICRRRLSEVDGQETNFLKGVPPSPQPFSVLDFFDNKSTPPPSSKNLMDMNGRISSMDSISSVYSESESSESDLSFRSQNYCKEKEINGTTDEKQQDDDEEDLNMELWRKRILLGERCQPLNFTGCIHYDEYGNLIREFPTRKW